MIDSSKGFDAIAYSANEKPWHGLGQAMEEGKGLDVWLASAGMAWEAKKSPILFRDDRFDMQKADNDFVIYRDDTKAVLGIVSDRYQIVQPKDVLEFYRNLCEESGYTLETAGCLDGGKKVWAQARTNQGFDLNGDVLRAYVLLATSFDGTLATRASLTAQRVVCANTLSMAYSGGADFLSVSHSTSFDARGIQKKLGIAEHMETFARDADKLASKKLAPKEALRYIISVMAGDKFAEKPEDMSTRQANICENVFERFMGKAMGHSLSAANGTLWGALNAVTEYVDHEQGNNANNRFKSANFGKGAELKMQAMNSALLLAA